MPLQSNWRFCGKCHSMYFNGYRGGKCPAGHSHARQKEADYIFTLPYNEHPGNKGQDNWRFCDACNSLYFGGYQGGRCPAGGSHRWQEQADYNFVLPHDIQVNADSQENWRFCAKCHSLYFNGYSGGKCPAGGHHARQHQADYNFVLPFSGLSESIAEWSGDSSQWPHEKKLRSMDFRLRPKVTAVLDALRARGFRPKIVYAWRSVAVQEELFKRGVTQVHFSFHNAQKRGEGIPNAYAADIVDERWGWKPEAEQKGFWDALGQAAHDQGLVWGGDWTPHPDFAHVQSRPSNELHAAKEESGL